MSTKGRKKNLKGQKESTQLPAKVAYEGHVSAKVIRGGKVVREVRSRNAGALPLFSFLVDCLAGTYRYVDRPMYIAALTSANSTALMPGPDGSYEMPAIGELIPLSPFPVPVSGATVSENSAEVSATVSLSFVVSGLSLSKESVVMGYALYSPTNASGYGRTTTESGEPGLGNYSAITVMPEPLSVGSGENVVVVWDLTLSNANV